MNVRVTLNRVSQAVYGIIRDTGQTPNLETAHVERYPTAIANNRDV